MPYLTNKKRITTFKSNKLIEIEKNVENISWNSAVFQVTQSDVALILQSIDHVLALVKPSKDKDESSNRELRSDLWSNHVNNLA